MKREALKLLQEWKERGDRKPLILRGARQVGKTWLMREFGLIAYQNVAYVNFENNRRSERSDGELDFVVQRQERILPIEVKAEENLHAKSLRSFIGRHPELKGLRFSMSDYREEEWMTNVPLYATSCLE